jgi:ABC-type branched-subunit amino acid transport system substrate-binding protein
VTNPAKVINVEGYCTGQPGELDKNTPYSFVGTNSNVGQVTAITKFCKKHYPNVKKVALVFPDDGSVVPVTPILERLFAANGLTITGKPVFYANETVDFNPIAAKINAIRDADAVFQCNGIGLHLGGIIKGLRSLGNKKPYGAVVVSTLDEVMNIAGKEATEDVYDTAVTADNPDNPSLMKEVIMGIKAKHGNVVTIFIQGANTLWVLKEAIEAAQSLDPTVVKNKWETMDKIQTIFGPGRMCGDETFGIRHHIVAHPQPVQWMKGGKLIPEFIDVGIFP